MIRSCQSEAELSIHDISIVLASRDDHRTGLRAYASAIVGPFRIDGLTIRVTLGGELRVRFPARRDGSGRLHTTVIPTEPKLILRIRLHQSHDVVVTNRIRSPTLRRRGGGTCVSRFPSTFVIP